MAADGLEMHADSTQEYQWDRPARFAVPTTPDQQAGGYHNAYGWRAALPQPG